MIIKLTPFQLDDVISCLMACYDAGMAYGQMTSQEQALYSANRKRLIRKLEKVANNAL